MTWLLIAVLITGQEIAVKSFGVFAGMEDCFKAQEVLAQSAPKPKVNYEIICVRTNSIEKS